MNHIRINCSERFTVGQEITISAKWWRRLWYWLTTFQLRRTRIVVTGIDYINGCITLESKP